MRGAPPLGATSSSADACPFLRAPGEPATSAVCIPVYIEHQPVGFVRALGAEYDPPGAGPILYLEAVAASMGQHLRLLRALVSSERKANTDALTGLLNRRALETRLRELPSEPGPACIALGDMRPGDVMARAGGEEFVVVLPGCRLEEAGTVLERVRAVLQVRTADGTRVPPFTLSWGLVQTWPGASAEELLRAADVAMYAAKSQGRDRVVIGGPPLSH